VVELQCSIVIAQENFFIVFTVFMQYLCLELLADVKALKPATFSAAPSVWNALFQLYQQKTASLETSTHSRAILAELYSNGISGPRLSAALEALKQDENIINTEFRDMLGGRLRTVVTGGALTSKAVAQFLKSCFGCKVG
jgi:long-subunit acyl-CoA synthetase (AMP-forming)